MSMRPSNLDRILEYDAQGSGFQSVVPGTAAAASPTNLLEMHIFRPTADLLNQKLWAWGEQSGLYGVLQEILMHARV